MYKVEKMDKNLKRIANQILKLESECQQGKNVEYNMSLIDKLVAKISIKDLFEINDYLEKSLTK